ncbi:MAG: hypothetical protein ACFBRM_13260 [Pikeienuella sp.]
MWSRALMIGPTAALGMLALVPGAGGAMARSTREAMAAGLAVNRAMQRQMLKAAVEAIEVVEDLIAEVRADDVRPLSEAQPVVVAGRPAGALTAAPRAADLAIFHEAGQRLRLRIRGAVGEAEMAALADTLSGFPGVTSATLRPLSKSVIVVSAGPAAALAASLEEAGVARFARVKFQHPAALLAAALISATDSGIRSRTRGKSDLRTVLRLLIEAAETIRRRNAAAAASAAAAAAQAGGARR